MHGAGLHKLSSELKPLLPQRHVLVNDGDDPGRLGAAAGLAGDAVQGDLQLPPELPQVVGAYLQGKHIQFRMSIDEDKKLRIFMFRSP